MAKLYKITILSIFILFICVRCAFSDELRPEIGVQALGMAGAVVSYSDDPTSAIWNPANLARIRNTSAIYDLSQGALFLSYHFRKLGSLGLSIIDRDSNERFMKEEPNSPIGKFQFGDNTVMLSYARDFYDLMLGASLGLNRTKDADTLWQPNFDIGGIMRVKPNLFTGFSLIDLGGTEITDQDNNQLIKFKQQFTLGATWLPEDYVKLGIDLDTSRAKLRLGTEIDTRWLSLRFGTVADLERKRPLDWSLGGSLKYENFQVNYTYLDNPDLTYKHLLSVGFKFGEQRKREQVKHKQKSKTENIHTSEIKSKKITEFLCRKYNVEVPLILAVIRTESNFNPKAVSSVGAVGLMQLMPPTARDLGLQVPKYRNRKRPNSNPRVDERFNPRKNLEAGVRYFSQMLKRYNENYVLAIAAYNAGPGNVKKDVPLIDETERHVGKVLNHYYSYKNFPQRQKRDLGVLDSILD